MICRAKILRLKQHHKKSFRALEKRNSEETANSTPVDLTNVEAGLESAKCSNLNPNHGTDNEEGISDPNCTAHSLGGFPLRLPNSASNYSINNSRLSASSSNQSFASGMKKDRACI